MVERDGHTIYTIDSTPHANAPVVWGKERLVMREDYVLLEEIYYDQDLEPLKRLETLEIGRLGGRTFATRMRMTDLEAGGRWTELTWHEAEFNVELPDRRFTLYALRNPEL